MTALTLTDGRTITTTPEWDALMQLVDATAREAVTRLVAEGVVRAADADAMRVRLHSTIIDDARARGTVLGAALTEAAAAMTAAR